MARNTQIEQELADAYAEISTQDRKISELQRIMGELEQDNKTVQTLQAALKKANELLEEKDAVVKTVGAQVKEKQSEIERLEDIVEQRDQDVDKLTKEAADLKRENKQIREATSVRNEDSATLRAQLEEAQKNLDIQRSIAKGQEVREKGHLAEIKALQEQLAEGVSLSEDMYTDWMSVGELSRLIDTHGSTISRRARGMLINHQGIERREVGEGSFEYRALKAALRVAAKTPEEPVNKAIPHIRVLMPSIDTHRTQICGKETKLWEALMDLKEELRNA